MRNIRELLATVIIAALMLICTTAALNRKSHVWQEQQCRANLAGLHKAFVLYAQDFEGELPLICQQRRPQRWLWWSDFILPYVQDARHFYCPANTNAAIHFEKDIVDELLPPIYDMRALSFGMNFTLGASISLDKPFPAKKHRLADIANPAQVILLADSKTPNLRGTKWCWKDDYAPVHQGRFMLVNCDGSTRSADKDSFGLCQPWDGWKQDPSIWKPIFKSDSVKFVDFESE